MMRVRGRRVWAMAVAAWLVGGAGVFAQDGKRLVAGTSSGEIAIWDASNQKVLTRSSFAKGEIEAVVVSEDGDVLYTVLPTGELKAIDTKTGEARHSVALAKREAPAGGADANRSRIVVGPGPQSATQIALVGGKDLLVVVRGSSIEVRKASDLSLIRKFEKAHTLVTGLALDKTGRRVATVGQDGRLRIASLETLEVEREVKHAHPLYAVAFSPDGRTISFGGQEKKVYAVAVKGGDPVILSEKQPFDITALGYNHTGDVLAIGDESCDVWLLDVEAKAHLFHGKHHVECWLSSLAWAPDNETFLFGCRPTALAEASAASSAEPAAGPEGETVVAIEGIQTAIQAARTRHSEAHALTDEERKELAEIEKSIEAEKQALLEALGAKDLARDLDESVSRRAEACRENCERIQGSFTINQWKVKKK